MESVIRAIGQLRSVCDVPQRQFDFRSPKIAQNLEYLYKSLLALSATERILSPEFANYVNAPIYSLLQKEQLSDRQTEYILLIVGFLFNYPWSTEVLPLAKVKQYLSVCVYIMAPIQLGQDPEIAFKSSSSEVRFAGFQCLRSIIEAAAAQNFSSQLESPQTQGLIIFALNGIKYGTQESDQLAAIDFLRSLLTHVVSSVQPIVPNSASVLSNFIIGGYGYRHTAPRVLAIKVLGDLLVPGLSGPPTEWTRNSSVQIDKIIARMAKDAPNTNEKVQKALILLAESLASECWESLELCQSSLMSILLRANNARTFLANPKYHKALDAKMIEYLDAMPTILSSHDASSAVDQLNSLGTYIALKGSRVFVEALINRVQESLPPLSQTSKDMHKDTPDSQQIMRLISTRASSNKMLLLEELQVCAGIDSEIQLALQSLLATAGGTNWGNKILGSLLPQLEMESGLSSVQSLWIATCVIRGKTHSVEIANDYLSYAFNIVDNCTSFYQPQQTPSVIALNAYLIGELALNPELDFQQHLVDGLFPVVDLLGSGHSLIIAEAKNALTKIAMGCGYSDVKNLILSNKDYVLDGISLKLNTMDITPATLTMLGVLILMTGNEIVVYLDDIIASLFIILDRYHGYTTLVSSIFEVFSATIEVMNGPTIAQVEEKPRGGPIPSLNELKEELKRKPLIEDDLMESAEAATLNDSRENCEVAESNSDDEGEADDFEPPMDNTEEWDSPIEKPVYLIAKKIFDRCNTFLTHKSSVLQASILKVVGQCISILGTSHKGFLPEIHAIWPVVTARVADNEIFVAENAFHVVAIMCSSARDFMTSRIEKLWQELSKMRSREFYVRPWPEFSLEQRWINALCRCFAGVLKYTRVDFATFDSLLWTLKPILKQQKLLMEIMGAVNEDDLWLCMNWEPIESN